MNDKLLTVRTSPGFHQRLRVEAAIRDLSLSELVRDALGDWLDENGSGLEAIGYDVENDDGGSDDDRNA